MATNSPSPAVRKIRELKERITATYVTQAKLSEAAAKDYVDDGYVEARNIELSGHRSDLRTEITDIGLGQPVTVAPSQEQIEALAKAVAALAQRNVTAAAIHGIVSEGFTLAGIASD